ncbi:hypothetical protein [Methanobrevibacter sp.]|nr:hypothetical protein [Methanobrevibacter sp.]MBQ2832488.1 hypothetical protein [Methanobrevibacter sp.]
MIAIKMMGADLQNLQSQLQKQLIMMEDVCSKAITIKILSSGDLNCTVK